MFRDLLFPPLLPSLLSPFLLLLVSASLALGESEEEPASDVQSAVAETRMSPELLWKLGRLGESDVSSDGNLVVYSVTKYELAENTSTTSVMLLNLKTRKERILLREWKSVSGLQFATSPFGERVYFSGKQASGEEIHSQVWTINPTDGGLVQVTKFDDSVGNLKVSPTGEHIAFTLDIKLDKEVTELYADLPKADARIIDNLMFRHWNAWHDYKYSHLHIAGIDADGHAEKAIDLMEGIKADCPVPPFGGSEQFNWAPDGKQIAYTAKIVEDWAESTNSDVYTLDLEGAGIADWRPEPTNITAGQTGYDNDPVYSPDGRFLAYHSMERAGFEADRNRVMILNRKTGEVVEATAGLDQTAHKATWVPGSDELLITSEWRGTDQVFRISLKGEGANQTTSGQHNVALSSIFADGKRALVGVMSMLRPLELAVLNLNTGKLDMITDINGPIYEHLELPTVEEKYVRATDGKKIHCWVIYPPNFDADKKYPLITYCQGGPQGQIGQWFSYRWNFHLMAAQNYVVIAPNRRGLPGFGREWNDSISRDWGGQAMKDILSATDAMLSQPYIDPMRSAAIGASFGGYTVYWLMGNHEDRYQTMVAHCGVFNLESMYGSTEELFFVNWDLGGPYWKDTEVAAEYAQFSPHRFVRHWKTPLLVIHGEKDFRVPVTQGIEAFTAAQVEGVPSRFLYFPEEGHWVMGAQNGVLWHRCFFDWLDRTCKPASAGSPAGAK